MRKTPLQRRIEADHQEPLERLIVRLTNETDWPDTYIAAYLGISKATLTYWCLLAGIQTRRVRLLPGQELRIAQNGHQSHGEVREALEPSQRPTDGQTGLYASQESAGIPTPEDRRQRYDR